MKFDIVGYVYEDPKKGSRFSAELQTRLIPSNAKALRGFHHIDLADLLCPLRLKREFERDPMYVSYSSLIRANNPLLEIL